VWRKRFGATPGDRWQQKQALAAPSRYYGDGGTIHGTTVLDAETRKGKVVSVWFRCQMLPFEQHEVEDDRAGSMTAVQSLPLITGVEVLDS